MKKKLLIILVSVILISFGAVATYKIFDGSITASIPLSRQGQIITNDFQLSLPFGWETEEPAPENFVLKAIYKQNESNDYSARRIGYKTNLYIAQEELNGKTVVEYIEVLKENIKKIKGEILFHSENETSFNNNKAYLIDVESKENNIEFKSILGVIQGQDGEVWVMSFNTPKLDWDILAPQFYGVLDSFKIRE
jgi:hypothetical protein